jgi:hypothetical protein
MITSVTYAMIFRAMKALILTTLILTMNKNMQTPTRGVTHRRVLVR